MIKEIFPKYIQKSNFFIYPQLGFKRGIRYKPVETYISVKDETHPAECILICQYRILESVGYLTHINKLKSHELFKEKRETEEYHYYIFDFSKFESDFLKFVRGEYSKFSEPFKQKILDFFSQGDLVGQYIESYLYPELYYTEYSKILGVNKKDLETAIELCDKPDLKKETVTLQLNVKN
jgi:hypothetical protein